VLTDGHVGPSGPPRHDGHHPTLINLMKKITILLYLLLASFSAYADIYKANNMQDIKKMAEDIFAKRNPEKTVFIFPLEKVILRSTHPAMQTQDKNYNTLITKAFANVPPSKTVYIKSLLLIDYPHELADPVLPDLIDFIQENKAAVIVVTPNLTGKINKIDFLEVWTWDYLKSLKIDLSRGVLANKKFIFDKESDKISGTYPSFYKGLLSCNSDNENNSSLGVIATLFITKFKKIPNVVVAVATSASYLEALEKQLKILDADNEFFGILYTPKEIQTKEISPEDYLQFWQNFVKNLNKVTRKEVALKKENPYEE